MKQLFYFAYLIALVILVMAVEMVNTVSRLAFGKRVIKWF